MVQGPLAEEVTAKEVAPEENPRDVADSKVALVGRPAPRADLGPAAPTLGGWGGGRLLGAGCQSMLLSPQPSLRRQVGKIWLETLMPFYLVLFYPDQGEG